MNQSEMMQKIERGDGFIAALDQSGGSTPKALQGYGYQGDEWSSDEEMFDLIHQMRTRIITSPCFGGGKVIGAILFERTMDGEVDGKPVPQALIDRGIVPFIKIDKGLEDEENGVQMMKPIPGLDELLVRAKALGVFGTKERSVINSANLAGIAVLVAQQFQIARQVLAHNMVPIVEPEVNIKSADRAAIRPPAARRNPRGARRDSRRPAGHAQAVDSGRGRAVRAAGRSSKGASRGRSVGRISRGEACRELARNPGLIASFSRALLSDLRHQQSDEEFDRTLETAIDEIYQASTEKVPA